MTMPNAEGRMEDTVETLRTRLAVAHDTMKLFCIQPCQWCNGSGCGEVVEGEDGEPERLPCERCQGDGWESLLTIEVNSLREQLRSKDAALAAARAENERMRADLDAVRKVVQLQADRDWIIVPWLNDAGDYVWRVNVRDVPSKKKGADTYTGTEHVGATPLDAGLRALAAQEGMR